VALEKRDEIAQGAVRGMIVRRIWRKSIFLVPCDSPVTDLRKLAEFDGRIPK
jgi:hypothetical protein